MLYGYVMKMIYFCNMEVVVLFDGTCNLCNGVVQFILKRDKAGVFKFASLQSNYASKFISCSTSAAANLSSILFLKAGKKFDKSTAALHIAKELPGFWPLLYGFIIIPKFIRDWVYDWIAKNRYKWFGRQKSCWVPTPELKSKFLDT